MPVKLVWFSRRCRKSEKFLLYTGNLTLPVADLSSKGDSELNRFEWPECTLFCDGSAAETNESCGEPVREGNSANEGIVMVFRSCLLRGSLSSLAVFVTKGESSSSLSHETPVTYARGFADVFWGGALVSRRTQALSLIPCICSCLLANTWDAFSISRKRIDLSFSSCCSSRLNLVWWTLFLFKAEFSSAEVVMFNSKAHQIRNSW